MKKVLGLVSRTEKERHSIIPEVKTQQRMTRAMAMTAKSANLNIWTNTIFQSEDEREIVENSDQKSIPI